MTECKQLDLALPRVKGRQVRVDFGGGDVSSDGGLIAIREVDRKMKLTERVARLLRDPRMSGKVEHKVVRMLRQRVYGICAGWEDLNDAEELRHDPLLQTLAGRDRALASASTLCRLENQQDRATAIRVSKLLVELFLDGFEKEPEELILDFDATNDPVHGHQEGRFFHGYYDEYCFLPLYVFCGDQLLVAYLRQSNQDAAKHAGAILKLLVRQIRSRFPNTRIIFRGDSGFCRDLILSWCDRFDVGYVVGIARNKVLEKKGEELQQKAAQQYAQTGQKQRLFGGFEYKAGSWNWMRWVIHKAEHTAKGSNPRFVVTSLDRDEQTVYEQRYCPRGEMENRIKEQMQLFSDRTSAHEWWPNQWRVLLSALAYTLMEKLRSTALKGTEFAKAQMSTIRSKLLKIGAVITRNSRTVHIRLSSSFPKQQLFALIMHRLGAT